MTRTLNIKSWIRGIDLMSLRLFASIVEERNIARAAARESIAASAVTKRMQDLEATLGFKLLYRDPKGTTLTPIGELTYRHALAALAAIDGLHRDLSAFAEGVQGHIRVSVTESALIEYVADDVAAFQRAFPMVSFDIQEAHSAEVLRSVALGTADVGICTEPTELPLRLACVRYKSDRLVAVMTRINPLAGAASLDFSHVLESDLIGWSDKTGLMHTLQEAAQALGQQFRPKYRVASSQSARSLVRAGLGIAIQPEGTVWPYEDAERICSVPLRDAWARRNLSIFMNADRSTPGAVQALVQHFTTPATRPAAPTVPRQDESAVSNTDVGVDDR